jgi:hypothetical protein
MNLPHASLAVTIYWIFKIIMEHIATQVTTVFVRASQPGLTFQYIIDVICEIQHTKVLQPDQIYINYKPGFRCHHFIEN